MRAPYITGRAVVETACEVGQGERLLLQEVVEGVLGNLEQVGLLLILMLDWYYSVLLVCQQILIEVVAMCG